MLKDYCLPFTVPLDKPYYHAMRDRLHDFKRDIQSVIKPYQKYLDELNLTPTVKNVNTSIDLLLEAYEYALFGQRKLARTKIEHILKDILESEISGRTDYRIDSNSEECYFRIRKGVISPGEIKNQPKHVCFHVPINRVGLISQSRYSAAGLPSLYCSTDLNTAWLEMKRPNPLFGKEANKEGFNAAMYRCYREMRVLNLALPKTTELELTITMPDSVTDISDQTLIDAKSWSDNVAIMPLLLAVHTQVSSLTTDQAKFRPEYLIPEFISELIIDASNKQSVINRFDGIRYTSIQNNELTGGINYVFFPTFKGSDWESVVKIPYCPSLSNALLRNPQHLFADEIDRLATAESELEDTELIKRIEGKLRGR